MHLNVMAFVGAESFPRAGAFCPHSKIFYGGGTHKKRLAEAVRAAGFPAGTKETLGSRQPLGEPPQAGAENFHIFYSPALQRKVAINVPITAGIGGMRQGIVV